MKKTITFTILFLLLISSVSAQTNQENQITPNSSLYFLDRLFEKIQLFLTTNEIQKLNLRINFLNERIDEFEITAKNKPQFIENAKRELDRERDELINASKFMPDSIRDQVEVNLEKSLEKLENLQQRMPDNIGIRRAVEVHKENIERFSEKKEEVKIKIIGNIAEIKARINNQIVGYRLNSKNITQILNDLSVRTGVNVEKIKGSDIEINDKKNRAKI